MQRKKRKCKKERLLTYPGLVALVFLWQTLKLFGDVKSFWNTNEKFVKLLAHFGSQFFFREESYVNEKQKRNKEKKDNMQFFFWFFENYWKSTKWKTYPCCINVPMANQKLFGKVKSFWNTRPAVSSHGSGLAHSYGENLATIQIVIETKM